MLQGNRIKFMDSGSTPGMTEPDFVIPAKAGIWSNSGYKGYSAIALEHASFLL